MRADGRRPTSWLGKASPAGRLPVTWGKALTDYPATDPKYPERSKKGVDGKTTYSEGVNVGYRWFDKERDRAAVSVRVRAELHDIRVLET